MNPEARGKNQHGEADCEKKSNDQQEGCYIGRGNEMEEGKTIIRSRPQEGGRDPPVSGGSG